MFDIFIEFNYLIGIDIFQIIFDFITHSIVTSCSFVFPKESLTCPK